MALVQVNSESNYLGRYLEEVVGEIQDEFDSEEEDVEEIQRRIENFSLTALHEHQNIGLEEEDEELPV